MFHIILYDFLCFYFNHYGHTAREGRSLITKVKKQIMVGNQLSVKIADFFCTFFGEIFGHIKKKQYLCTVKTKIRDADMRSAARDAAFFVSG